MEVSDDSYWSTLQSGTKEYGIKYGDYDLFNTKVSEVTSLDAGTSEYLELTLYSGGFSQSISDTVMTVGFTMDDYRVR